MEIEQTLPSAQPEAESPPARERTPWGYADMAKAMAIVIGGTVLVTIPAVAVAAVIAGGADIGDNETALGVVLGANVLLELVLFAAAAHFTVRKYNLSWAAIGLKSPSRGGWWLPLALLVGALVIIWSYFATLAALGAEPTSGIPDEAFDSVPLATLVGVLSLAFAPIIEETFFRGFLFGGLRGRWGPFGAALATGFLFALAHIDPLVFIPFTAVGMIFAWGYVYSGSILASVIAHLFFNAISFGLAVSGVAN